MTNWFLKNLRDTDDTHTASLVVMFSVGLCIASLVFVPILYRFSGAPAGIFLAILAIVTGCSSLVLRWTGSVRIASQSFLLCFWVLLTGIAILLGTKVSPAYPAYVILAFGATFLVGRRSGIMWTGICVVTIVAVYLMQERWIHLPKLLERDLEPLFLLCMSTVIVLVGLFSLQYDSAKNDALIELRKANLRITRMVTQLEQASTRLVSSSEQLLGTGRSGGLVGRMLEKARDGRESIEKSRQSIAGMIEQYRQISTRVRSLHKYSQTIVDVVSTIDRISDRLDVMALNVGIEAAQSGTAGKQFTILADDMRFLAERVLKETTQIKSALKNVQGRVQQVLESSTYGEALTEESADKMATMVGTFDDIYQLIADAEGATELITADTLAQLDAVRAVVTAAVGQN